MNYQISSGQFDDPDMPELLRTLASFFQSREIDFYVVGAVARDIVLGMINNKRVRRKTDDLDIAIMIRDWDTFEMVNLELSGLPEFTKSSRQKQRFHYKNRVILDIIPFGEIARADKTIHWPPDETPVMSVAGFIEMAKKALFVTVDNEFTIGVASLPGIFILKLIAWQDRCRETDKDAQDLALLINEYFDVNFTRIVEAHPDIFKADDFTTFTAGAVVLGRDVRTILSENRELLNELARIVGEEVRRGADSLLIGQILETHRSLKYVEVHRALGLFGQEIGK